MAIFLPKLLFMSSSSPPSLQDRVNQLVKDELDALVTIKPAVRPWHWVLVAAIGMSSPVFIGAMLDQLAYGLLASFGAMSLLNLPMQGSFFFRMGRVLACSFGLVSCFAVGLIANHLPWLTLPLLWFGGFWVVSFGRYYQFAPPAGMFIIMALAVALFMPTTYIQIPTLIGVVALGSMLSGMLACAYSMVLLYVTPDTSRPQPEYQEDLLMDSLLVSFFMMLSLGVAMLLEMPRPYWAPVSCFIILLGVNFRSIWTKQLHRILGTGIGMVLAWWLMSLQLNAWGVAAAIFGLALMIEGFIARHYVLAVIFITPLTILLAEYGGSSGQHLPVDVVIASRFWDTVIGCVVGLLGAAVIHSPKLRPVIHAWDIRLSRMLGKQVIQD